MAMPALVHQLGVAKLKEEGIDFASPNDSTPSMQPMQRKLAIGLAAMSSDVRVALPRREVQRLLHLLVTN